MPNPRIDELKKISVTLQTHWDETKSLWNDKVRDRADKQMVQYLRGTIELCLKGHYGQEHVYGRGMYDLFDFIDKSAARLSKLSDQPTNFEIRDKSALTERFTEDTKHKKKYSDKEEEDIMTDYDIYPVYKH